MAPTPSASANAGRVRDDTRRAGVSGWRAAVGIAGLAVTAWVGRDLYAIVDSGLSGSRVRPPQGPQVDAPGAPADAPHDPSKYDHG